MKKISLFILFGLICLGLFAQENSNPGNADNSKTSNKHITFSIYSGMSVPIKGANYWNNYWGPNYLFAANTFIPLNRRLSAGLRVGFNHWIEDQYALTKDYPSETVWGKIDGHINILEVSPSVRYILTDEYRKSNLFLQAGVGYTYMTGSWILSGGVYKKDDSTPEKKYPEVNENFTFKKPNANIGIGIKGGRIEIMALYNLIFTSQEPTQYVTVNFGLSF